MDKAPAEHPETPQGRNARLIRMAPRADLLRGQPPDAALVGLEVLQELDRMLDAHFE